MAIDIKFDLMGNPEPPTIILANRNGNKLGQLDVNIDSIDLSGKLNDASEFTFTLNKHVDGKLTNLWDKVVDFKLVYCKEWDTWFEIKVELDEATETVKTVFCTQLGQAELSQIMLYNIEINTEEDIARDDYKISILYDERDPKASILNRLLDKAPHYSIAYVDPTIARIQRSFSFDDTSICDAFNEIAEEIGCLFVYDSNSDENGMPRRTVSVYDLQQYCNDCGYRGEFTDICPKCNSINIRNGYGEDTLIFVTSDELASEGIQLVTDTDSVKNCFKLEAGDDLMTATIRNCNPNGTDYIWYFSDSTKEDMSRELVEKIESYDEMYKRYYNEYNSNLDTNLLNNYNSLVNKYSIYNKELQSITSPVIGYSALMNAYYNTIDLASYLKSGLMPSIEMSETNAEEQVKLLTSSALSPVAVENITTASRATANSSVLSMAKIIVKSTYKVEIENPDTTSWIDNGNGTKTWIGKFVVTNYSDEEDTAISDSVSVVVNGEKETFIKQKIEKTLNKENTDDYSISGLFEKEYNDFCEELKKYALNPLISFYDACEACIGILISQKVAEDTKSDLYKNLYTPYYNKLTAIESEIKIREDEINIIVGVYDDKDYLVIEGLQQNIEGYKKQIQTALDFESYLGEKLWLDFCTYRREDKYSNENYISDGLNNAELFERALEFIEVAENEIYKSSELQHSISTTLNNLLAIPKFKPLVKSFKCGNWIRVRIDDEIYKLRLLKYDISYGDFNNIPVEFSDVTKIKNGITDVGDILSQVSSMTSSYDTVKRQSQQGNEAQSTIEQWLDDGLKSANVKIKSNDNEEILITKNGLLGRSKSDITDEYSPEQFKLTHNVMAYTTDNWETVSTALGKHDYVYWDGTKFVNDEDYGLSTKFVDAGHIISSQFIGGEIVSSNYKKNESGTYINLIDGDFDFAGGKIVYDAENNNVTLKGVTIQWDAVNPPAIQNVTGLSAEIEKINALNNGLGFTTIDGQSVVSPNIVGGSITGGYLNIINPDNKSRVVIDPNNSTETGYIFQVYNGTKTSVGIDSDGNAVFNGVINASDGTFTGTVSGSTITGGSLSIKNESGTTYAEISEDGVLSCANAYVKGEIEATKGTIGGFYIGGSYITSDKDNKNNYTSTANGVYLGTDGISCGVGFNVDSNGNVTIDNGSISIYTSRTDDDGNPVYSKSLYVNSSGELTLNGYIYASGGTFTGTITGSTIEGGSLLIGDKKGTYAEITSEGVLSCQGANITGGSLSIENKEGTTYAKISSEGVLSCANAVISGEITAKEGEIGGFAINSNNINKNQAALGSNTVTSGAGVYIGTNGIGCGNGAFKVDSDGDMTVTGNASINGWGITSSSIAKGNINISYSATSNSHISVGESHLYSGELELDGRTITSHDKYIGISSLKITNNLYASNGVTGKGETVTLLTDIDERIELTFTNGILTAVTTVS